MFAKLLKHEWRSNSKLLGGLTLAALGVGLLATILLRVMYNYGEALSDSPNVFLNLLVIGMGLGLLFSFVALCLYAVAVQVMLLFRFYKHKFSDEGYLTFTLPVSTTQIFWSSLVNMLIWMVISLVTVFAVIFLVILFGTATTGLINGNVFRVIEEIFELLGLLDWEMLMAEVFGPMGSASAVCYLLLILVSPFYSLIIPMACITIGAVVAKKHKLAAAIGIYYGLNMVVSFVSSLSSILPSFFVMGGGDPMQMMFLTTLLALLLTVGLTLGGYFVTTYLMKHKLNLP